MEMVMETKTTKSNRGKEGFSFLLYALEAFGVVGMELLIGNVIEPKIYGVEMSKFNEGLQEEQGR